MTKGGGETLSYFPTLPMQRQHDYNSHMGSVHDFRTDSVSGDDLSMLIATGAVLHRVFTFDKSLRITVISGFIFAASMTLFIIWHCIEDEKIMHSILFGMLSVPARLCMEWIMLDRAKADVCKSGIMIVLVGAKTRSIIGARVSDKAVRRDVKRLATWGTGMLSFHLLCSFDSLSTSKKNNTK